MHYWQIEFEYLYAEGSDLQFMNQDSFEQVAVPSHLFDDTLPFVSDGMRLHKEQPPKQKAQAGGRQCRHSAKVKIPAPTRTSAKAVFRKSPLRIHRADRRAPYSTPNLPLLFE